LRSELYGAITLAFGQQVVSGNQLLLWSNRGTRVPANVSCSRWRPDLAEVGAVVDVMHFCGVARKP
jgi:hypothetical protein